MPTYQQADRNACEVIDRMKKQFHQQLDELGVTIDCLFAFPNENENGDITSPAVTVGGYKCLAKVRVISLKDRVMGRGDAEITIDKHTWDELSSEERDALVDHELEHLEVCMKEKGRELAVVRDDLDRVKLKLRKHDYQFGWFNSVARRHGADSQEVQQAQAFSEQQRQTYLFDLSFAGSTAGE
jgi:hypothetical protein